MKSMGTQFYEFSSSSDLLCIVVNSFGVHAPLSIFFFWDLMHLSIEFCHICIHSWLRNNYILVSTLYLFVPHTLAWQLRVYVCMHGGEREVPQYKKTGIFVTRKKSVAPERMNSALEITLTSTVYSKNANNLRGLAHKNEQNFNTSDFVGLDIIHSIQNAPNQSRGCWSDPRYQNAPHQNGVLKDWMEATVYPTEVCQMLSRNKLELLQVGGGLVVRVGACVHGEHAGALAGVLERPK